MKRYKQSILSDYFVTGPEEGVRHIAGANYDIEDQGNSTLCGRLIYDERGFKVLTNRYLAAQPGGDLMVCHACKAALYRRIANIPGQVHLHIFEGEPRQFELPVYQLGLDI